MGQEAVTCWVSLSFIVYTYVGAPGAWRGIVKVSIKVLSHVFYGVPHTQKRGKGQTKVGQLCLLAQIHTKEPRVQNGVN